MPFDPNLPATNSPIVSAELRSQFTSLKALIDDQAAGLASLTTRVAALENATPPALHVASGFSRAQSNGLLTQVGMADGAPKYITPGGDYVVLGNSGTIWFIYPGDPAIYGPSISPQYSGGANLTDPWTPQDGNLFAGTIS